MVRLHGRSVYFAPLTPISQIEGPGLNWSFHVEQIVLLFGSNWTSLDLQRTGCCGQVEAFRPLLLKADIGNDILGCFKHWTREAVLDFLLKGRDVALVLLEGQSSIMIDE